MAEPVRTATARAGKRNSFLIAQHALDGLPVAARSTYSSRTRAGAESRPQSGTAPGRVPASVVRVARASATWPSGIHVRGDAAIVARSDADGTTGSQPRACIRSMEPMHRRPTIMDAQIGDYPHRDETQLQPRLPGPRGCRTGVHDRLILPRPVQRASMLELALLRGRKCTWSFIKGRSSRNRCDIGLAE